MSARAKASNAVGSVIDGRFRDLQEQRDLGFPVWRLFQHFDTIATFCATGRVNRSFRYLHEMWAQLLHSKSSK